jgi:hypothetical protein
MNKMPRPDFREFYPSGFRSKCHTAADVIHKMGPALFLFKVLPWSLCRNYVVYSQSLETFPADAPSPRAPFALRRMGKEDIPHLINLRKGYYSREILERRMEAGHLGFIGWSGSTPVHIRWAFTGSLDVPYFHRRLVQSPEDVFTDEAYTAPSFRKSGIYAASNIRLRRELREMGFRRINMAVADWNETPRRACLRSGMSEIAEFGYWNIAGIRKFFWSGAIEVHDDGTISFTTA